MSSVLSSIVIKWSNMVWMVSLRLDVCEQSVFGEVVIDRLLLCLFVSIFYTVFHGTLLDVKFHYSLHEFIFSLFIAA